MSSVRHFVIDQLEDLHTDVTDKTDDRSNGVEKCHANRPDTSTIMRQSSPF